MNKKIKPMHSNCDKTKRNSITYVSKRGKRGETDLGKKSASPALPDEVAVQTRSFTWRQSNVGRILFGQPIGYQNNQNRLRKSGFKNCCIGFGIARNWRKRELRGKQTFGALR